MTAVHQAVVAAQPRRVMALVLSSNVAGYNIRSAAIAAGWDQITPLDFSLTINSGVIVYAANTGSYALDTGTGFPVGTSLSVFNNGGFIVGRGGPGANGVTSQTRSNGGTGGPALRAQVPVAINNAGVIGGGGGGGGAGAVGFDYSNNYAGGGGGGGGGYGSGGSPGGGSGNHVSGGGGGWPAPTNLTGPGGSGGYVGAGGGNGGSGQTTFFGYGGGAGPAVVGNANIAWVATGTRYGAIT